MAGLQAVHPHAGSPATRAAMSQWSPAAASSGSSLFHSSGDCSRGQESRDQGGVAVCSTACHSARRPRLPVWPGCRFVGRATSRANRAGPAPGRRPVAQAGRVPLESRPGSRSGDPTRSAKPRTRWPDGTRRRDAYSQGVPGRIAACSKLRW